MSPQGLFCFATTFKPNDRSEEVNGDLISQLHRIIKLIISDYSHTQSDFIPQTLKPMCYVDSISFSRTKLYPRILLLHHSFFNL